MLNLYQSLKSFPPFSRQLICKGMLFTNYDCPQQENKMPFFIEQSFIVFVLSGKRIYHWQQQSWTLSQGTCALIKRGCIIAERPAGEAWCVMAFFVPDEFLLLLMNENKVLFSNSPGAAADEPVIMLQVSAISQSCFFSMLPYFTQSPPPPENLIELKFKELVLSLLVNTENAALQSYLRSLKAYGPSTIRQVMDAHFSFRLKIADYAKLSCKSVSTFKREFRRQYNESPARWLVKKRVELAKDRLLNTSLPVSDISMECGFENPNHFSRVFKEKTGASPLQFRQKAKSTPPAFP